MNVELSAVQTLSSDDLVPVGNYANIENILNEVINKKVADLGVRFRKELRDDNLWSSIANDAEVRIDDGQLIVRVNNPLSMDLEYGTPQRPMRPRIRAFEQTATQELNELLNKVLGGIN